MRRNVAILIFPEVEVLDFAGPFEVFSVADKLSNAEFFNVYTLAESAASVRACGGLTVVPTHTFESMPVPHILIVPGGNGTRPLLKKPALLEWLRVKAGQAEIVASVCTGSLVLGKAGLLKKLRATTHHGAFDELAAVAPDTEIVRDARFIDNGQILTSAGISAGIEQSLHIVGRLYGPEFAERVATYMEYHRAMLR